MTKEWIYVSILTLRWIHFKTIWWPVQRILIKLILELKKHHLKFIQCNKWNWIKLKLIKYILFRMRIAIRVGKLSPETHEFWVELDKNSTQVNGVSWVKTQLTLLVPNSTHSLSSSQLSSYFPSSSTQVIFFLTAQLKFFELNLMLLSF